MPEPKSVQTPKFKIFDLYDITEVEIKDPALKTVINLEPKLVLKSYGRYARKFGQTKLNIIERLINRLSATGHRGKKHKIEVGRSTGKYSKNSRIVLEALKIIEERTKTNPIIILGKAIENSAPRDEITVIEYGGARYPQAVDVSPLRRVNLSLKHLAQGGSDKAFNKKKTFAQGLAEEIIQAYNASQESFAVKKRIESERQADSAR